MTKERRQHSRLGLTLPVRVKGYEAEGTPWEEMSSARDVSPSGVAFFLKHPVVRGHVILLSLPLPKRFRSYNVTEPSYHVYALVRNIEVDESGSRVGVMFLGKHPPRGFEKDPGGLFLLPTDPHPLAPEERRQFQRLDIFVNFKVRRLDGGVTGPQEERTIAENIGKGGARVLTSLAVAKGEVLMLEELGGSFQTRAEVRNIYIGGDHVPRLNLKFLDATAPDRLVSTS